MTLKAKIHNRFAFCVNFLRPLQRKKERPETAGFRALC